MEAFLYSTVRRQTPNLQRSVSMRCHNVQSSVAFTGSPWVCRSSPQRIHYMIKDLDHVQRLKDSQWVSVKKHENMLFTNTHGCGNYCIFLSDNSYALRGRAHKGLSRDVKEDVSIRTGRPLTIYSFCKWLHFPEGRHPGVFNLDW